MGNKESKEVHRLNRRDFASTYRDLQAHIQEANQLIQKACAPPKRVTFQLHPSSEQDIPIMLLWKHFVKIRVLVEPEQHYSHELNYKQFYALLGRLRFSQQQQQEEQAPTNEAAEEKRKEQDEEKEKGNEEAEKEEEEECVICMERRAEVALSCTHAFCSACIEEWKRRSTTCPMCRENISQQTDDMWVLTGSSPTSSSPTFFSPSSPSSLQELLSYLQRS
ncbi:putative aminoacyltransferase, E1 ubiquitin-activating enzyme [Balamuthia mandrillaris]